MPNIQYAWPQFKMSSFQPRPGHLRWLCTSKKLKKLYFLSATLHSANKEE